jgi:hypothetical protein
MFFKILFDDFDICITKPLEAPKRHQFGSFQTKKTL